MYNAHGSFRFLPGPIDSVPALLRYAYPHASIIIDRDITTKASGRNLLKRLLQCQAPCSHHESQLTD